MTVCEYIRNEYIKYIETPDNRKSFLINPELKGSYEYFKLFCEYICDGGYIKDFENAGIIKEQLEKAVEQKYMKKQLYSNWKAQQTGKTLAYWLTAKGKKAIYNYYKEW